jgi:hypothetical protein
VSKVSNRVQNVLYNSNNIKDAWRVTDDFTSYTQWGLDTTIVKGQVVPLIFNDHYQNTKLNLSAVKGNIGAYPFIRYIDIGVQKDPTLFNLNGDIQNNENNFSQTFPNGISTQQSNVTNLDNAKKLLFNTIPANVAITDVQIAPFGGAFVDLFPGNITTGGTTIDLESFFGTPFGGSDVTLGTGFTIKVTANNTSGGSQQVNMTLFGTTKMVQNNIWLIDYQDAYGQLHRVGTFNDMLVNKTFELDRLINVPITDTNPNFGTLLFTILKTSHALYTIETYNIVVSLSVAYLLTNQVG